MSAHEPVAAFEPCQACRATGEWSDGHRCSSCGGSGEVPAVAIKQGKCPKCGESLKYDGGLWTCPNGHGNFATEILRLSGDMRHA